MLSLFNWFDRYSDIILTSIASNLVTVDGTSRALLGAVWRREPGIAVAVVAAVAHAAIRASAAAVAGGLGHAHTLLLQAHLWKTISEAAWTSEKIITLKNGSFWTTNNGTEEKV